MLSAQNSIYSYPGTGYKWVIRAHSRESFDDLEKIIHSPPLDNINCVHKHFKSYSLSFQKNVDENKLSLFASEYAGRIHSFVDLYDSLNLSEVPLCWNNLNLEDSSIICDHSALNPMNYIDDKNYLQSKNIGLNFSFLNSTSNIISWKTSISSSMQKFLCSYGESSRSVKNLLVDFFDPIKNIWTIYRSTCHLELASRINIRLVYPIATILHSMREVLNISRRTFGGARIESDPSYNFIFNTPQMFSVCEKYLLSSSPEALCKKGVFYFKDINRIIDNFFINLPKECQFIVKNGDSIIPYVSKEMLFAQYNYIFKLIDTEIFSYYKSFLALRGIQSNLALFEKEISNYETHLSHSVPDANHHIVFMRYMISLLKFKPEAESSCEKMFPLMKKAQDNFLFYFSDEMSSLFTWYGYRGDVRVDNMIEHIALINCPLLSSKSIKVYSKGILYPTYFEAVLKSLWMVHARFKNAPSVFCYNTYGINEYPNVCDDFDGFHKDLSNYVKTKGILNDIPKTIAHGLLDHIEQSRLKMKKLFVQEWAFLLNSLDSHYEFNARLGFDEKSALFLNVKHGLDSNPKVENVMNVHLLLFPESFPMAPIHELSCNRFRDLIEIISVLPQISFINSFHEIQNYRKECDILISETVDLLEEQAEDLTLENGFTDGFIDEIQSNINTLNTLSSKARSVFNTVSEFALYYGYLPLHDDLLSHLPLPRLRGFSLLRRSYNNIVTDLENMKNTDVFQDYTKSKLMAVDDFSDDDDDDAGDDEGGEGSDVILQVEREDADDKTPYITVQQEITDKDPSTHTSFIENEAVETTANKIFSVVNDKETNHEKESNPSIKVTEKALPSATQGVKLLYIKEKNDFRTLGRNGLPEQDISAFGFPNRPKGPSFWNDRPNWWLENNGDNFSDGNQPNDNKFMDELLSMGFSELYIPYKLESPEDIKRYNIIKKKRKILGYQGFSISPEFYSTKGFEGEIKDESKPDPNDLSMKEISDISNKEAEPLNILKNVVKRCSNAAMYHMYHFSSHAQSAEFDAAYSEKKLNADGTVTVSYSKALADNFSNQSVEFQWSADSEFNEDGIMDKKQSEKIEKAGEPIHKLIEEEKKQRDTNEVESTVIEENDLYYDPHLNKDLQDAFHYLRTSETTGKRRKKSLLAKFGGLKVMEMFKLHSRRIAMETLSIALKITVENGILESFWNSLSTFADVKMFQTMNQWFTKMEDVFSRNPDGMQHLRLPFEEPDSLDSLLNDYETFMQTSSAKTQDQTSKLGNEPKGDTQKLDTPSSTVSFINESGLKTVEDGNHKQTKMELKAVQISANGGIDEEVEFLNLSLIDDIDGTSSTTRSHRFKNIKSTAVSVSFSELPSAVNELLTKESAALISGLPKEKGSSTDSLLQTSLQLTKTVDQSNLEERLKNVIDNLKSSVKIDNSAPKIISKAPKSIAFIRPEYTKHRLLFENIIEEGSIVTKFENAKKELLSGYDKILVSPRLLEYIDNRQKNLKTFSDPNLSEVYQNIINSKSKSELLTSLKLHWDKMLPSLSVELALDKNKIFKNLVSCKVADKQLHDDNDEMSNIHSKSLNTDEETPEQNCKLFTPIWASNDYKFRLPEQKEDLRKLTMELMYLNIKTLNTKIDQLNDDCKHMIHKANSTANNSVDLNLGGKHFAISKIGKDRDGGIIHYNLCIHEVLPELMVLIQRMVDFEEFMGRLKSSLIRLETPSVAEKDPYFIQAYDLAQQSSFNAQASLSSSIEKQVPIPDFEFCGYTREMCPGIEDLKLRLMKDGWPSSKNKSKSSLSLVTEELYEGKKLLNLNNDDKQFNENKRRSFIDWAIFATATVFLVCILFIVFMYRTSQRKSQADIALNIEE